MGKRKPAVKEVHLCPRLRVMWGGEVALGPGRVDLLELIGETELARQRATDGDVLHARVEPGEVHNPVLQPATGGGDARRTKRRRGNPD
ncbi:hypothetical protein SBV1_1440008 [Verrucomicrobia bacterium]|nr:hypothetical protein SBV1_1440008 [Verrucomicrobiota bacterium]